MAAGYCDTPVVFTPTEHSLWMHCKDQDLHFPSLTVALEGTVHKSCLRLKTLLFQKRTLEFYFRNSVNEYTHGPGSIFYNINAGQDQLAQGPRGNFEQSAPIDVLKISFRCTQQQHSAPHITVLWYFCTQTPGMIQCCADEIQPAAGLLCVWVCGD